MKPAGTETKADDAAEQVVEGMRTVSEALKAAAERTVAGHQEIAQCAMRQAEEHAVQLMETLRTMASERDPAKIANTYTQFMAKAAKNNAKQLLEIGQALARTGKEAWDPIVQVMLSASNHARL